MMDMRDSINMLAGVPIIVVVPALVEIAKQNGLPVRMAGVVSMMLAMVLLAIGDVALDGAPSVMDLPRWVIAGVVYGLAAAGLYSQRKVVG